MEVVQPLKKKKTEKKLRENKQEMVITRLFTVSLSIASHSLSEAPKPV